MLTRRENLLMRPWQERRFIYHREKVQTALPAIDNSPPPQRPHVFCKLKKVQKEAERCSQIVSDNFTLLQHLSNIMRTTRVDHFWEEPPPNFLQRVGVYKVRRKGLRRVKTDLSEEDQPHSRRERCYGCSPQRFPKVEIIPEERIPFPPPKERITRRAETPPDWEKQYQFRCSEDRPEFRGKVWNRPEKRSSIRQHVDVEKRQRRRRRKRELMEETQSIYLSKDGLTLAVKFPSRTEVLMTNQSGTRVLERELCECKSFPRKFSKLGKSRSETLTLKSPDKLEYDQLEKEIENDTLINTLKEVAKLKINEEQDEEELSSNDEQKSLKAEESLELAKSEEKSDEETDSFFDQLLKEEYRKTFEMDEEEEPVENYSNQVSYEEKSVKEEAELTSEAAEKEENGSEEQAEIPPTELQEYIGEEYEKSNSDEINFDFWGLTEQENGHIDNNVQKETEEVVKEGIEEQSKEESFGELEEDELKEDTLSKNMVEVAADEIDTIISQDFEETQCEENISEESVQEKQEEEETFKETDNEEENTNKTIEKIFESVENVIAEIKEEDWMDELDIDLIESMRENQESNDENVQ
ncbi:uncharacterized protein [Rhodnius prolixus]|uniref:uncharacterized protein n=1 Tax=Rhodnius prolixus TaxID=13249 RepID=UPI003D18BA40